MWVVGIVDVLNIEVVGVLGIMVFGYGFLLIRVSIRLVVLCRMLCLLWFSVVSCLVSYFCWVCCVVLINLVFDFDIEISIC